MGKLYITILHLEHAVALPIQFVKGSNGCSFLINHPWGFIDKTGQMIIAPTYEEAQSFHEGMAAVKLNGLWGFLS